MSNIVKNNAAFFVENNTRYVFVDGNANDTLEKCYATLQTQLSIPEYFGHNLDALEEVMHDLDWIQEEKICIIISAEKALLQNEAEFKNDFLEILETSSLENITVVYLSN
jgi:RNAse (barnase) inhibitor barstar